MHAMSSLVLITFLLILEQRFVQADDWPQWRGPLRNNISQETGLLKAWPAGGPQLRYRINGLGAGIAAPAVVGKKAYTISAFNGYEYVVAFDTETGERLWMSQLGIESKDFVAVHSLMRWLSQRTPTIKNGKLYAVTAYGVLTCLATADGTQLWSKDFRKEYGVSRQTWGYCDYPLVDGDMLICVPGGSLATIVALNTHTGQEVWSRLILVTGTNHSAHAATLSGQIQDLQFYVAVTDRSLSFVAKSDGRLLASYEIPKSTAVSHTPIFDKDEILFTNGYGGKITRLALSLSGQSIEIRELFSVSGKLDAFEDVGLIVNGKLLHTQLGILTNIDARTGNALFSKRMGKTRFSHTYADSRLYCAETSGLISLIDPNTAELETQSSFQLPDIQPASGVSLPVIANKRLYLRFDNQLFCYELSSTATSPQAEPRTVEHIAPKLDPSPTAQQLPVPIYSPTPDDVVKRMLEAADLKSGQLLVDLGSGDGRIVVAAAKQYGARSVGYEIDEELIATSRNTIEKEKISELARIEAFDMYKADLSKVDVLAIYLYPVVMDVLKTQISHMPKGSVIVSHQFRFPGIAPEKVIAMQSQETGEQHSIYVYRVPLENPVR